MKFVLVTLLMLATLLCFGQEKRKGGRRMDIEVVECAAHRTDSKVAVEGRVKNTSTKTVNGLVLLFDFIGTDGQVVTTKNAPVEEETLAPDGESRFHFETTDPVRAVEIRVQAMDGSGRELRVSPATSTPIE
ncbi:MAG: FxLYD domain-containing protein [Bryobacteraceae bacterium]